LVKKKGVLQEKKSSRLHTRTSTGSIFKETGRETSLWIISLEKKNPNTTLITLRRHNANINSLFEKGVKVEKTKSEQLLFFVERLKRIRKEYENVNRTLI
jgi:hypothetical protein